MKFILGFLTLCFVKTFSHLFYRARFNWPNGQADNLWKDIKLIVFLNHTSLYEPLYLQAIPYSFLWTLVKKLNVPGADITLNRPIVGRFWKLMMPNISSITRKKDASWHDYLKSIKKDSIIIIAPEGRMKRLNGLDKFGKPMTVKPGVADIIDSIENGTIIFAISGGLHHVQAPGQFFPRIFKDLKMNLFAIDVSEYKSNLTGSNRERKIQIINDLQSRLENHAPKMTLNK